MVPDKLLSTLAGMLIALITIICLLPEQQLPLLSLIQSYALHFMFTFLILGFLYFSIDRPRMMMAYFVGCAVLALQLEEKQRMFPDAIEHTPRNIRLAFVDASSLKDSMETYLLCLAEEAPALLALKPLHEKKFKGLRAFLGQAGYSFSAFLPQAGGPYGMALFSRHQLSVPPLSGRQKNSGTLELGTGPAALLDMEFPPPQQGNQYLQFIQELTRLARQAHQHSGPTLVFGSSPVPIGPAAIQHFCGQSGLQCGSRPLSWQTSLSTPPAESRPEMYIFHSNHFKCISFRAFDADNPLEGMFGSYQILSPEEHVYVEKSPQEL